MITYVLLTVFCFPINFLQLFCGKRLASRYCHSLASFADYARAKPPTQPKHEPRVERSSEPHDRLVV